MLFKQECIEGDLIIAAASIVVAVIGMFVYSSRVASRSCHIQSNGCCMFTCTCESEEEEHRDEDAVQNAEHAITVQALESKNETSRVELELAECKKDIVERDRTIQAKNQVIMLLKKTLDQQQRRSSQ